MFCIFLLSSNKSSSFESRVPHSLQEQSALSELSELVLWLCAVNHKQMPGKARENYTKAFDKGHSLIKSKIHPFPAAELLVTFDESSNPLQRARFGYRAW